MPAPADAPEGSGTASPESPSGPGRSVVLVALVLYGTLGLWSAAERDFWRDEPVHALILREMETGPGNGETVSTIAGWLTPTLFGEPFLARPPLLYWLSGGFHLATGLDPRLAYRLPVMLASLLGLWLTYRLGGALFDRRIGFLALLLQGSTVLYFARSTWLGTELLFIVFCEMALVGLALGGRPEGRASWKAAGWIGLAGASLSGHALAALALVFIPLVVMLFLGGGVKELRARLRRAAGGALWLLFPLLAAPWFAYQAIRHPGALLEHYVLLARPEELPAADGWAASPLYYLLVLAVGFLPWTYFLALGLLHGKDRTARPGQRLCFYWFLIALVGLSVFPAHGATYALFFWPPVCLLIPAAFYETEEHFSVWEEILGRWGLAILPRLLQLPIVLVAAAGVLWYLGVEDQLLDEEISRHFPVGPRAYGALSIAALGAIVAFIVASRVKKIARKGDLPVATFESARAFFFFIFSAAFLLPLLDPLESARPFLEEVDARVEKAPLATYGTVRPPAVSYYLAEPAPHLEPLDPLAEPGTPEARPREALVDYLDSAGRVFVLTSKTSLDALEIQFPGLRARLHPTELSGRLGGRGEYVLLANRPTPPPEAPPPEEKPGEEGGPETRPQATDGKDDSAR